MFVILMLLTASVDAGEIASLETECKTQTEASMGIATPDVCLDLELLRRIDSGESVLSTWNIDREKFCGGAWDKMTSHVAHASLMKSLTNLNGPPPNAWDIAACEIDSEACKTGGDLHKRMMMGNRYHSVNSIFVTLAFVDVMRCQKTTLSDYQQHSTPQLMAMIELMQDLLEVLRVKSMRHGEMCIRFMGNLPLYPKTYRCVEPRKIKNTWKLIDLMTRLVITGSELQKLTEEANQDAEPTPVNPIPEDPKNHIMQ